MEGSDATAPQCLIVLQMDSPASAFAALEGGAAPDIRKLAYQYILEGFKQDKKDLIAYLTENITRFLAAARRDVQTEELYA